MRFTRGRRVARMFWVVLTSIAFVGSAVAQEGLVGKIDLMKSEDVAAVKGEWRYAPIMTGVGPKNNEIEPKAHGAFDDGKWEVLKPETLGAGRGPGKYSWCWYRTKVTIPDTVQGKAFAGGPVWLQTTVDDYGEIWIDGVIDLSFGKSGRGAISGFNTRNRVRLQKTEASVDDKGRKVSKKRDAKPGDVFQVAVLGINSPLGNPPSNKIFLRSPTNLEFFSAGVKGDGADVPPVAVTPEGKQVATINLLKSEGTDLVKGAWRRHLVTVHTGPQKNEIEPKAHGKFDDGTWEVIKDSALLAKPFGPGKFSMAWYRIQVTLPAKIGDTDVTGTAAWLRTTVDDYAEIWVDGKIDLSFGKSGRGAISGFNKANEVKLTDSVKGGETIQISILAINGPFGNPPGNSIFFRPTEVRFLTK